MEKEVFNFLVPQKPPKRPYLTRYKLTMAEAAERYVGAVPDLQSREVREVQDVPVVAAKDVLHGREHGPKKLG